MQTIFWHDYETFGIDTKKDKPSQFAGVRTDLDLNIVGSPLLSIVSLPKIFFRHLMLVLLRVLPLK